MISPKIISKKEILNILPELDLLSQMAQGFTQYSSGKAIIPPIGELLFPESDGECHIKYGYVKNEENYVVKIASGFYNNSLYSLPTSNGVILIFSQKTGMLRAVLLDEGLLTEIRTAMAGLLCANYFAPAMTKVVGILGTGSQARWQLEFLVRNFEFDEVLVYGRSEAGRERFKQQFPNLNLAVVSDPDEISSRCDLIVTATPSSIPLINGELLKNTVHITAVGSDTPGKRELDECCLKRAVAIYTDSNLQCKERGELQYGQGQLVEPIEIGALPAHYERPLQGITIADLTGVAIQDIKIAQAVLEAFEIKYNQQISKF